VNQPAETSRPTAPTGLTLPIAGTFIAIAATTTMDATGLFAFSAIALLPLMFLFWYLDRLPAKAVGFSVGKLRDYGLALLYPIAVIALIALSAAIAKATDFTRTNWIKAGLNFVIISVSTLLVAIVTEEGFFRGWLWASLRRHSMNEARIIIYTCVAFSIWHISAVTIAPDFKPPVAQVPIFLINAAVIGAIWGLMRSISGSIIVISASHGLWNGLTYVFFGFGTRPGALGIANTALFGPEIGILGLALNLVFAIALWRWWKTRANSLRD
jgi:CAAX protease family protein